MYKFSSLDTNAKMQRQILSIITINASKTLQKSYLIIKEIETHSLRTSKIKPFTNKYNWERTDCSSRKDDWIEFEKKIQQLILICYMLEN